MIRLSLAGLLLLAGWLASAACADEHELLLPTGERMVGQAISLEDGTLRVAIKASEEIEASDEEIYAPGQWIRWGHPAKPAGRPAAYFGRQSVLVAKIDWTGKVPITIDGDSVTIATSTLGKATLPRDEVRVLLFSAAKEPELAEKMLAQSATSTGADRVWLLDGDLLTGEIIDFDGTTLNLEFSGQTLPVLAKTIAAVAFAREVEPAPLETNYLVGLDEGSLIEATDCTLSDGQLTVKSLGEWTTKSPKNLAFLQSLTGGVRYLSDLEPVDFRHTPYFTGEWPLGRDRNLHGHPLRSAGHEYAKGLAMHSAARAVYRVPDGASTFAAEVALDDSAGKDGSVVFRVYRVTADGAEQAYESTVVRGGDVPQRVSVPLDGAAAVVLVVDYADFGDQQDHANWLDARFVP